VISRCSKDEGESSKSIESKYPTLSIQWLVVYPAIKKRSDSKTTSTKSDVQAPGDLRIHPLSALFGKKQVLGNVTQGLNLRAAYHNVFLC
jgi:hypothetical protein